VKDSTSAIICRIKRATGGDPGGSGATRLASSCNFKSKYGPDCPRVRLQSVAPMRMGSVGELDHAGLIAPDCPIRGLAPPLGSRNRSLAWPSYARCLAHVPRAKNHDGKDRSAADSNSALSLVIEGGPSGHSKDSLWPRAKRPNRLDTAMLFSRLSEPPQLHVRRLVAGGKTLDGLGSREWTCSHRHCQGTGVDPAETPIYRRRSCRIDWVTRPGGTLVTSARRIF
jgi:hypothetical protein